MSNPDPKLKFAENTADEGEGLSDAGIETYRDDPFPAVARETVQNSRDAHDKSPNPVRIEFKRFMISQNDFPDIEGFRASAQACLDTARADENEKEVSFFEQAVSVLNQNEIPVLRIADYNTKGLRGPCTSSPPTPFYALVKSSGSSVKDDQSAGGSFGIGKSAVYSASDLQTVFYSTIYRCSQSDQLQFLCQGKTKFRSHRREDGKAYRSTGYWGNPEGYLPIDTSSMVPAWARRDTIGTSVFSLGVRDSKNWEARLICSIIVNFYGAISDGKMELQVEDQVINKSTLQSLLENPDMRNHAPIVENFDLAKLALECLSEPAKTEYFDIAGVGKFRLDLFMRDGLPKKVVILRNGMVICTELSRFGDQFARFQLHKDFIAVLQPVEPDDEDAELNSSEWMRRMENPRHDELSPERLSKETDRRTAKAHGAKLAKKVREVIKSEAKKPAGQRTALDELSEFFADDTPSEEDPMGQRGIQTIKIKKGSSKSTKKTKTRSRKDDEEGDQGGSAEENGDGGKKGDSKGGGSGAGEGGAGKSRPVRPFKIDAIRTLMPDPRSQAARRVHFTPLESGAVSLSFRSAGVAESEDLLLKDGVSTHELDCTKGQRVSLDVEFDNAYPGPVEIIANTNPGDSDQ